MVQPDLVHCLDWMTALLPAMARAHGIPCLYTLYSLESVRLTLAAIEEHGIDAASFWQKCYFERMPQSYEETRAGNPVDLLASAVFSAHFVSTPSPALSRMIADDACDFIDPVLKKELRNKLRAGCLAAVEHAPPVHFDPSTDRALWHLYGASDHAAAKAVNKVNLQRMLRLREDARAPLFLWPTRLDPGRRGCRLMAEAMPALMSRYERQGLQVVFVADGGLGDHFRALAGSLGCGDRVAVCDFNPRLCRRAHAAADFLLVPMQADPCGLAWRIGHRYGTLPIGYDPGGIRDALAHLETDRDRGNGFVFRHFDTCGLEWAVAQAIGFYGLPDSVRARQITRIMAESRRRSDDQDTARGYIELYERVLRRPFGALRGGSRPAEGAGLKAAA